MTSWANNRRHCRALGRLVGGGIVAVAIAGLSVAGAVAETAGPQTGAPISLLPPVAPQPSGVPPAATSGAPPDGTLGISAAPPLRQGLPPVVVPQAAPTAPAGPVNVVPGERNSGVQIGALAAPDPSSAGLLAEGQGGLPTNMWQGSEREAVEHALNLLPATRSPTALRLSKRLLLSIASVPAGPPAGAGLLAIRIERLIALGASDDAAALAALAPSGLDDRRFDRAAADAAWLKGNNTAGCAETAIALGHDDDAYWDEANVFCQVLDGRKAEARLSLDLLRDAKEVDSATLTLLALLTGEQSGKLTSLPAPSPLAVAILRESKLAVPADAVKGAGPAELAALATLPKLAPDLRLAATERAVSYGALPPATLATLYAAEPVGRQQGGKAASAHKGKRNLRTDAVLYQATEQALTALDTAPADLVALLRAALDPPYRDGGPRPLVRTLGPDLVELQPRAEYAEMSGEVGRALLALGQLTQAKGWLALARTAALTGDPSARRTAARLGMLVDLADPAAPAELDPTALRDWWGAAGADAGIGTGDKERNRQALLLFTLCEALGRKVPADFWAPLYQVSTASDTAQPSPAVLHTLAAASTAGRVGETLTFALLALGDGGPAQASPATLSAVINSLRQIGLDGEAYNLAVEAALANDL